VGAAACPFRFEFAIRISCSNVKERRCRPANGICESTWHRNIKFLKLVKNTVIDRCCNKKLYVGPELFYTEAAEGAEGPDDGCVDCWISG
jgi:hypothetical protein